MVSTSLEEDVICDGGAMKKDLRKIGILLAVLCALVVILLTVLIVRYVKQKNIEKQEKENTVELVSREQIKSMTITRENGEELKIKFNLSHEIDSFSINENEFASDEIVMTEVDYLFRHLASFSISNTLDLNGKNVADYGLSPEKCRVTVNRLDGSTEVLLTGGLTSDKNGVYVRREGEDKAYVAEYAVYQAVTLPVESFLNRYVIHLERNEVSEISFQRKSTGDSWLIEILEDYDNGVFLEPRYQVHYPMERDANNDMILLINSILQFQADRFISVADEDLSSFGLDDPEYLFELKLKNGQKVELGLSMELGGYYYGICSNIPYVFSVDPSYLAGMNKSPFELIDSYVIHGYLDDVRTVNATIKDKSFVLDINLASDRSFVSEDTTVMLDQRNAKVYNSEGDCYGLLLFGSIFQMPVSRVDYDAQPVLENVEASFSVVKTNSEITSLKLVPKENEEYYCFINDRYSGFIVSRSVLYKDNGYEMSGFGVWDAYLLANEAIDNKNSNDVYNRP